MALSHSRLPSTLLDAPSIAQAQEVESDRKDPGQQAVINHLLLPRKLSQLIVCPAESMVAQERWQLMNQLATANKHLLNCILVGTSAGSRHKERFSRLEENKECPL